MDAIHATMMKRLHLAEFNDAEAARRASAARVDEMEAKWKEAGGECCLQ